MVAIAAYEEMGEKRKLAEFYLLKANALTSTRKYEEAILYYKYGSTLAEEIVSKEYTIRNCKLVASYLFYTALYYEEIEEYEAATQKFWQIPHYISEWSNEFCDTETSWLLASAYGKAGEYYFYKHSNYDTDYLLVDAIAKCSYSEEIFLSIIKRELSTKNCLGLLESSITLAALHLMQGRQKEAEECFADAKRALKKCEMLSKLAGEEDGLNGKRQLIHTLEQRFGGRVNYSREKLFLLIHNYLYGSNWTKHKNCII